MKKLFFEIQSNHEIWSLIDKRYDHILIHKFRPNEAVAWWETDIKMKNGEAFEHLQVRNMEFDVSTDLKGLKRILELNTLHLCIYQFNRPIPNTLSLEYLSSEHLEKILEQNGLQHIYFCKFEFLTLASSDEKFLSTIENSEPFKEKIAAQKEP
ncbi:MAG: hypothetical protein K0M56_00325 [Kaistella sp.]|nr:hypothetical protein [Kaistella sp.]